MIVTCQKCQAQYKLNSAVLGASGRDVRCISCSHTWFQIPEEKIEEEDAAAGQESPEWPQEPLGQQEESPAQQTVPRTRSVTEDLSSILEKDGEALAAVLSTVAENEEKKKKAAAAKTAVPDAGAPRKEAQTEKAPVDETFADALPAVDQGEAVEQKRQTLPQETVLPIVTHNPLGMNANVFGGMVFLFCSFLTLSVVFIGKNPILRHWPSTALLYQTLGFHVPVPGEGLKFSDFTVERRIDDQGKTLVISGQMANMTNHDIAYPPLGVILKNADGAVVTSWDLKTGVTQISGGDSVPVMMKLDNAPAAGSTVELRVKGKQR